MSGGGWNGAGVVTVPAGPEFPAVADDVIRSAYYNSVVTDLCSYFSNTIPRDGQVPLSSDFDGAGVYSFKNLPVATVNGMAVRYNEFNALVTQVNNLASGVEPFILQSAGII